jgi:uncharacterized HAD superfamily protein
MRVKICSIDLDGILDYYPECWVEFINKKTKSKFKTKEEAKEKLGTKYTELKDEYRKGNYKLGLKARKEGLDLVKFLKDKGYFIIITTNRPFKYYPNLFNLTWRWLNKNDVPFDTLANKLDFFSSNIVGFHVDDDIEDAVKIAATGTKVFLFNSSHSNITEVKDLKDIRKMIG